MDDLARPAVERDLPAWAGSQERDARVDHLVTAMEVQCEAEGVVHPRARLVAAARCVVTRAEEGHDPVPRNEEFSIPLPPMLNMGVRKFFTRVVSGCLMLGAGVEMVFHNPVAALFVFGLGVWVSPLAWVPIWVLCWLTGCVPVPPSVLSSPPLVAPSPVL